MKRWLGWVFRAVRVFILKTIVIGAMAAVLLGALVLRTYRIRAEAFDLANVGRIPERSAVCDTTGRIYAYLQGENRLLIPLSRVPQDFIHALLAREDSRFFRHSGVDYLGILRAVLVNLRGKSVRQGASTITQQLARNSFGLTARTVDRKLVEAMLARRIEQNFSKNRILELYINRIYLGSGVYGLERAAQVYFGKSADVLTLPECAMLAGLIRSPNRMSPTTNLKGALTQRNEVLDRMVTLGMLRPAAAAAAKAAPVEIVGRRHLPYQQSYAMDAVRRDLDFILTQDQIDQGGLRIYTTLDAKLQAAAEQAVEKVTRSIEESPGWGHPTKADFDAAPAPAATAGGTNAAESHTPYLQAALTAIDNRSGAVRALVGGRDYNQSKFDRATLARRQVGSTFKPFVYATAFEHGLLPGSLVRDSRIAPGEYKDLPRGWSPENSDGEYGGWLPAGLGLVHSRNTMSVRVGEVAGLAAVRKTAKLAGIGKDVPPYPVVFLGGFETTLKDLTTAYTAFPNRGERKQSYLISRIENADGRIIFQVSHARVHTLGRGAAWLTSELLRKVLRVGTGAKAARLGLTKPAAGKTGTTNDYRDAWFVGYTSSLTCGVWVGFDRPQTIMEKGYGATLALPIWIDCIEAASDTDYPARPLTAPEPLANVRVCSVSGGLATPGCNRAQTSYPMDLPLAMAPKCRCTLHDALIPILAAQPVEGAPTVRNSRRASAGGRRDGALDLPVVPPRWAVLVTGGNGIPAAPLQAAEFRDRAKETGEVSRNYRPTIEVGRATGVLMR